MTFHGIDLIAQERSRQINELRYSRKADDDMGDVLTHMAMNKLQKAFDQLMVDDGDDDRAIDQLKKAGALCAAAIDAIKLSKDSKDVY